LVAGIIKTTKETSMDACEATCDSMNANTVYCFYWDYYMWTGNCHLYRYAEPPYYNTHFDASKESIKSKLSNVGAYNGK